MDMVGWVIGTGTLWVLNAILVAPLASAIARKSLLKQGLPFSFNEETMKELDEETKSRVHRIVTRSYILVDILILGGVGFLAGVLFGVYFIGFSLKREGWPGMMMFILSSLLGATLHAAA